MKRSLPLARLGLSALLAGTLALALAVAGCRSMNRDGNEGVSRTLVPGVAFAMLRDTPQTAILDLRSEREFHGPTGHLANARSLSPERLQASGRWLESFEDVTVLTYCASTCSAEVVKELTAKGLEVALVLEGGIEAWLAEGYGTVHEDRGGPPCS